MTGTSEASSPLYVVVIGDLVRSRELPDRAAAQDRLRGAVETFNASSGDSLAAPLELTGGDEMKTILEDPAVAVDVITHVSEAAHPMDLAWGIGRGPIETSWVQDVGELDGPCFHEARRAIEEASQEKVWGKAYGFSPLDDRLLTALLRLMGVIRATWTDRQTQYVRSVRTRSQKATAREIGVTPGAVSQSLKSARFHDVEAGEAALRELLLAYREGETRPERPSTDPYGGSS